MGKKYASPSAFRTALTQAAKKISRQTGMSMPELMKVFYFSRLAARVFTAEPDGWLIKGGQALLIRYEGAARLSRDIDLQCASPDRTAEEAAARVIEAATRNLDDFLRFVPGKFTGHSEEGRGGSQYFTVYLGNTKVDSVKVDLVVGRDLVGTPETRSLKSAVGLEWPVDWPQVLLYPVVDHVADKICAMYERHGDHGSNRYRDLADLLLISRQEHIPGEATHQALHREADRRRRLGTRITLPDAFQAPSTDWHDGYPAQAALVLGLKGCATFPEAARAAALFLNPLLDGSVQGTWSPSLSAWQ